MNAHEQKKIVKVKKKKKVTTKCARDCERERTKFIISLRASVYVAIWFILCNFTETGRWTNDTEKFSSSLWWPLKSSKLRHQKSSKKWLFWLTWDELWITFSGLATFFCNLCARTSDALRYKSHFNGSKIGGEHTVSTGIFSSSNDDEVVCVWDGRFFSFLFFHPMGAACGAVQFPWSRKSRKKAF